jgi:hypothetical protein
MHVAGDLQGKVPQLGVGPNNVVHLGEAAEGWLSAE